MSNLFQVPSIIQSIRTLVDGGCKLDIVTRELEPSEMTELFNLKNKEGWLLFKENAIQPKEVADLPEEVNEFETKSPSKRLYDRMFVYFKATHKDSNGFNEWRNKQLDAFGQQYLDRMPNK
jgi:hypothetical protein